MKSLVLFSTLLVTMGITVPIKAQTPPPECNQNNTEFAYSSGYAIATTLVIIDYSGEIDSPQYLYNKYPPGEFSFETEAEIECYKKGLQDGFEAGQK